MKYRFWIQIAKYVYLETGFDSIVIVKVRQSRKQIMVFSILPKTNETHYPE